MLAQKQNLLEIIAQHSSETAVENACLLLENVSPVTNPTARPDLLCKVWRVQWTTLDLPETTTVQRLAFNRFKYLTLPLHVRHVYQVVCEEGAIYSNVVDGELGDERLPVAVAVHGRYEIINDQRLNIVFERATISLLDGGDRNAWQRTVGTELNAEGYLEADVRFSGWSDTTFLDDTMRLARGMARNTYVLQVAHVPWAVDVAQRLRVAPEVPQWDDRDLPARVPSP